MRLRAPKRAAKKLGIEAVEMETRHQTVFATCEEGSLTESEDLDHVAFFQTRRFPRIAFRRLVFAQSTAHPERLTSSRGLKAKYRLKIIGVSNDARVPNDYRVQQPALESRRAEVANVASAQTTLSHRTRCNQASPRGEHDAGMQGLHGR